MPPDHPAHPDNAGDDDRKRQGFWSTSPSWVRWLLVVLLLLNWLAMTSLLREPERTQIPYSLFWKQVQSGNVDEVTDFTTQRPVFADDNLTEVLIDKGVTVRAEQQTAPLWQQVILGFGPTLLFIALLVWFLRRSTQMTGGGLSLLGRSRAKLYQPESGPRTTFADVAGIDEVKDEVMEVVDLLRDPERFRRLGATIPRGVLLTGAPGTGKTLLARAVAGEAGVPFFHLSASEFIEMIVGVGASRSGTCSTRRRRRLHRSSSSTSSPPSGAREVPGRPSAVTTCESRPSTRSSPRWTASPATRAWSCSPRPTAPRSSTRPSCAPGGSTAVSSSTPPTRPGESRSSVCRPAGCRSPTTSTSRPSPHRPPAWWAPT